MALGPPRHSTLVDPRYNLGCNAPVRQTVRLHAVDDRRLYDHSDYSNSIETSAVLDGVTTQDTASFITRGRETDRQVLFHEVRAWAGR